MEFSLNIFTLNCWGIPIVSKDRKMRIEAIVKYLSESSHNIVCLQEIWSENDYNFMKDKLESKFPFSHYFYSGVLGSGLCVFSEWIIEDVFFHQWPLNGYIHKVHHGDWFGGKGVGLCRIRYNNRLINVFCTHLHAEYHVDDIYLAHRVLQAYSTAEFINLITSSAEISLLAGDLNTGPGDLSYRLLTQISSLIDPCTLKCVNSNVSIKTASGTCDNSSNSYSDPKRVRLCPEGKRIDHVLFHTNSSLEAEVLNVGNPLPDRIPNQQCSYSDHDPVCLELKIKPIANKPDLNQNSQEVELDKVVDEATKVCREAIKSVNMSRRVYLITGGIIFFLLIGTVELWPSNVLYHVVKFILSALCFYCIIMGSLWNRMEMNSLKAGLTSLENFGRSRRQS